MLKEVFAGLLVVALVAVTGAVVYFLLESPDAPVPKADPPPAPALLVAATELASEMAPANPPITVPTDQMPIPLDTGDATGQ